ncbi:tetratricopeptide repeat protein [Leptolyngbyaceae cyanobacterium UHCC 1019]
MKNRHWLNLAESVMLVGSGVGSVATAVSQQLLYTAAPVSALLLLNTLNHRRLEQESQSEIDSAIAQLDEKLSGTLNLMQQQIQGLPSALNLANLRKDLQGKNQALYSDLSTSISRLQQEITKPEWRSLRQEMDQLQRQHAALDNSLAGVRESLVRLTPAKQPTNWQPDIEQLKAELTQLRSILQQMEPQQKLGHYRTLQDQISHINRRLNHLPAPFDANALKQDVEALIKMVGEMATRRDLSRLEMQIDKVAQQGSYMEQAIAPLKLATTILKKQLDVTTAKVVNVEVAQQVNSDVSDVSATLTTLQTTIHTLEQRLNQLATEDFTQLKAELQGELATQLDQVQQQLVGLHQRSHDLDQQHQQLRDSVQRLPHLLDTSALQNEVKYLATRVEWAETTVTHLQQKEDTSNLAPGYEFVFDVQEQQTDESNSPHLTSRAMLEAALKQAQARLVMVYPFPEVAIFDDAMMQQLQQFLAQKGCLDIGWGHLGNTHDLHLSRPIDRRRVVNSTDKGFLYTTLNQLMALKKQYPDQFRFKVLGTHEHFLVCDRAYAILGTPAIAIASAVFPAAAVGLRTTDSSVVQGLIDRFDNPTLDADDTEAYFNRASTRYDLGDYPGAIADYTEVLRLDPNDDITYNNRALVRYDHGDKAGAIADLDAAIQQNSENFVAYCNRGFIRAELGDKLDAIEDYAYAIHLNSDYAPAYFYRGLARTRLQNKLGAIQDYTEVIRLNPEDAIAYFYRGLACAKIGQRSEAIHDLRQAIQLFSNQGNTAHHRQALAALEKLHKTLTFGNNDKLLVRETSH